MTTSPNAPLYNPAYGGGFQMSINQTVTHYVQAGVPKKKIMIGLPLYVAPRPHLLATRTHTSVCVFQYKCILILFFFFPFLLLDITILKVRALLVCSWAVKQRMAKVWSVKKKKKGTTQPSHNYNHITQSVPLSEFLSTTLNNANIPTFQHSNVLIFHKHLNPSHRSAC